MATPKPVRKIVKKTMTERRKNSALGKEVGRKNEKSAMKAEKHHEKSKTKKSRSEFKTQIGKLFD